MDNSFLYLYISMFLKNFLNFLLSLFLLRRERFRQCKQNLGDISDSRELLFLYNIMQFRTFVRSVFLANILEFVTFRENFHIKLIIIDERDDFTICIQRVLAKHRPSRESFVIPELFQDVFNRFFLCGHKFIYFTKLKLIKNLKIIFKK